jgi:hypothetical protein
MNKLFKLISNGTVVTIERTDGVSERYHLSTSGRIVVTYGGKGVCCWCGHKHDPSGTACRCQKKLETMSLTGAYAHLNSVETRVGISTFDPIKGKLTIDERVRV